MTRLMRAAALAGLHLLERALVLAILITLSLPFLAVAARTYPLLCLTAGVVLVGWALVDSVLCILEPER